MSETEARLRAALEMLAGDGSGPPINVARLDDAHRHRHRRRVVATMMSVVVLAVGVATIGLVGARTHDAVLTDPTAEHPVTTQRVDDMGVYGVDLNLQYRSADHEHVLDATLAADGIVGRTELYQAGVDDDGPPQHPMLKPGEVLGISVFIVPSCGPATIGQNPVLTVVYASPTGGTTTRTFAVDGLAQQLGALARGWCQHEVMATVESSTGSAGCRTTVATLLVRNPSLSGVTLTVDGPDYRTASVSVPGGGSAQWTLRATTACPAEGFALTGRYDNGKVVHLNVNAA